MVVIQYTSPETLHFGHSVELLAAMVIGGSGSIIGSLLGGAWYVLVPQITNMIDPNLTAVLQGAILLLVLFILPGGLATLPKLWRRGGSRRVSMSTTAVERPTLEPSDASASVAEPSPNTPAE
jgi:branched-chain amino acid transport system permease protein